MHRNNIALGIIVVLASLLQGCGKKGPLTFPQPGPLKSEAQQTEPQHSTAQPVAPASQP